jgi:putative ABC transport system permease protein
MFLIVGLLAMIIALMTVIWQSLKAALMNPVEALRNE